MLPGLPAAAVAIVLLTLSNVSRTFAWYAHLKNMSGRPWLIAALASWGIALSVFVPFAIFYMRTPIKLDYLWAGLCMVAAAWFMFRGGASA